MKHGENSSGELAPGLCLGMHFIVQGACQTPLSEDYFRS